MYKSDLREYVKNERVNLINSGQLKLISDKITDKILNSSEFNCAQNIALYYPLRGEVDIRAIMSVSSKNFYFPRCNNLNLEFVKYTGSQSLVKGDFGILIPVGDKIDPSIIDVIYVPALMANRQCYRLGWGKGYYDKFFANNIIKAKKIIIIQNMFISDDFIPDEFDYKCDSVISEC